MRPLIVLACLLVSTSVVAEDSARFATLSEEFIHDTLALSPSSASQAGYHQHLDSKTGRTIALDSLLDDVSPKGVEEQRRVYARWRERFHAETPLASLDVQDAADWQLIDDQIGLALLELNRIQNYRHNPTFYVELLGSALFQPLTDDYAPEDTRLGHVLSRLASTPRFIDQARSELADADPIFIKVAIEENTGNIDLIQNTIAAAIPQRSKLRARFDKVAPPAVKALRSFSHWLQEDLANRKSERTWRLGKELYAEKFRLVMETPVSPDQVLADAERELAKTRADMLQIALPLHKQYFADHDDHSDLDPKERENRVIGEVLQKISDQHPRRDDLMQTVKDDLVGIRQFIVAKDIVSLTSRDNLKVIPTPPFMRGIYSVAGFHSAPPLDPNAEAEFWVTPVDPKTPA
jgi:uncharacterized protein (DUF885 family)